MTTSVSIDRTSLDLGPLVILGAGDRTTPYLLTLGGLGRPAMTARITSMPDSPYIHGSEPIAAVKEQTSLPLELLVQAASSAALDAAIDALDDALWQFSYPVTVTVDGVAKTWAASPASWSSSDGLVDSSRVAQFFDVLTVTIPVYPIPSS